MAIFTTADRDAVKAALITAATTGFASVSLAGQSVQSYSFDDLLSLLSRIQDDLAGDALAGTGAVRPWPMVRTIPPGAGT